MQDVAWRCFLVLSEDAQRQGGRLDPAQVERTLARRGLPAADAAGVWSALRSAGFLPNESHDVTPGRNPIRPWAVDSTRRYLQEIGRYRLLTADDERRLARRIEQGHHAEEALAEGMIEEDRRCELVRTVERGRRAFDELYCANLRLVVSIAKVYTRQARRLEFLDLIQFGNLGLYRAVTKFDASRGFKFSTYATWWIRQAITRGMADEGRIIRIPVHFVETIHRFKRTKAMLEAAAGRTLSVCELAEETGQPVPTIEELLLWSQDTVDLDQQLGTDEDGETLGSLVEADWADPGHLAMAVDLREQVARELSRLDPRAASVLRMRFGLDGDEAMTLEEVGDVLGVTRERIRQIQAKAFRRLLWSENAPDLADLADIDVQRVVEGREADVLKRLRQEA